MVKLNEQNYLQRTGSKRIWWLVKHSTNPACKKGLIHIGKAQIHLPESLIGKRIMFKMEMLED